MGLSMTLGALCLAAPAAGATVASDPSAENQRADEEISASKGDGAAESNANEPAKATGLAAPAAATPAGVYDFKVSVGPYGALFSEGFGFWAGSHGRFWLLDVTGQRTYSGYIEYINLHWRPDRVRNPGGSGDQDAAFFLGRVLRNWHRYLYTFLTAGFCLGDNAFPRVQVELELDFHLPQEPLLVFTFGGGHRHYDAVNRPYLLAGVSYSLERAAVIYRYWYDAAIASQPAQTHLLTLTYGERLFYWARVDFTWGDEAHPGSVKPRMRGHRVAAKSVAFTLEKWFLDWFGIAVKAELAESRIDSDSGVIISHRGQLEVRPFFTF